MKTWIAVSLMSAIGSLQAHAADQVLALCSQEPGGCHMECGLSECGEVCINGVDLRLLKDEIGNLHATVKVKNARSGALYFDEEARDLKLSADVVPGRYGIAQLLTRGKLSSPKNPRFANRELEQLIRIEVTPNSPNQSYGFYHADIDCDYSQVASSDCYSTQNQIDVVGPNEYGYVTTGRFECSHVDKGALGIQY